jgi:Arm DNA-binding domain
LKNPWRAATSRHIASVSILEKNHDQSEAVCFHAFFCFRTPKRTAQQPKSFTKISVSKMHCPKGKPEALFWDASCRGFGLRALGSGRRTWIYQYRDEHKRTRRIALGDVSAVALDAARQAARQHAASVTKGANPSVERKGKKSAASVVPRRKRDDQSTMNRCRRTGQDDEAAVRRAGESRDAAFDLASIARVVGSADVRFGSKTDIRTSSPDVRFVPKADILES